MKIKESFLARVEQSFFILKNNLIPLSILYLIFHIGVLICATLIFSVFAYYIPVQELVDGDYSSLSTFIPILVTLVLFLACVYLICIIPITIATLKSIGQAIYGEKIRPRENLTYAVSCISCAFKVYWYIFVYVLMMPAFICIVGGISIIIAMLGTENYVKEILLWFGIVFVITSVIYACINLIYRGTKTTFSFLQAVHLQNYSQKTFKESIKLTDGIWWRVFGNTFGIGLMVGLVEGFIGGIINVFVGIFSSSRTYPIPEKITGEDIVRIIDLLNDFQIIHFIGTAVGNILSSVGAVFILVFLYIFFLRIEAEKVKNNSTLVSEREEL